MTFKFHGKKEVVDECGTTWYGVYFNRWSDSSGDDVVKVYQHGLFLYGIINIEGDTMEKIYNKLVRDNIPNIISNNGEKPITRILNDEEYKLELEKKLYEEYQEVLDTKTKEDRIEELADMLEIIKSLAELENSSLEEVVELAKAKNLKRGGFQQKIFLEKVL